MLKELFKILGFAGKKASKSIGKSIDFVDDTLEKEYIAGSVEKTKEFTGSIVQKAGEAYQTGLNKLDEFSKTENFTELKDKAKSFADKLEEKADALIEKGKETVEDNPTIQSTIDKIKEEGRDVINKIEETTDELGQKLEDSIFGEEE